MLVVVLALGASTASCGSNGGSQATQTTSSSVPVAATTVQSAAGGTTTTASAVPDRNVLPPASVAPVRAECSLPLTNEADGNVTPLLCPDGGVNVPAWQHYAQGYVGSRPMSWSKTLGLGPGATSAQVLVAMCSDYANVYGTNPLTVAAEFLAAAYYGWQLSSDPSSEFERGGCPGS